MDVHLLQRGGGDAIRSTALCHEQSQGRDHRDVLSPDRTKKTRDDLDGPPRRETTSDAQGRMDRMAGKNCVRPMHSRDAGIVDPCRPWPLVAVAA
jgi:hypothetical protein